MIKTPVAITLLALTFICTSKGATLQEWTFDEPKGTGLSGAANAQKNGASWMYDLEESDTTGEGSFRIRRSIRTQANSYTETPEVSQGTVWLVAEIGGWSLAGSVAEAVRIGFAASSPRNADPFVAAQIKIERDVSTGKVVLRGEAFGEGTNIEQTASFSTDRDVPLTVVLQFKKTDNTYSVFYKNGGENFVELGSGKVDPTRAGRFLRLGATGEFATNPREFFDINSIQLSDSSPL